MNEPFADIAEKLLEDFPKLYIVHQTGKSSPGLYENTSPRLIVLDFIKDMHRYSGAADVIVARAGANTLAELAVQGKAVVVVPNKQLTSGHQVKNAERLEEAGAAVMIKESSRKKDASALSRAVKKLLKSDAKRRELAKNLHETYPRGAARKLAMLLLEAEKHPKKKHVVKKTKKRH